MPPKRKAATMSSEVLVPKKVKVQKRKQEVHKANKEKETRQTWFDRYADPDTRDVISPDGCQQFFTDLGVDLESVVPLVVGWKINSKRMGYMTQQEFMQAMATYNITTPDEFKKLLKAWEISLDDPDQFRQLYLFSFNHVKSSGQKSMDVETAIALWNLLLTPKYPIIHSFIQFLQEKKPVKVINKDQWSSLLDFCKAVPEDLSQYDCTSS
ncbi:DCN1-like protein 4, partial [Rhizopus stolonifer]